MQRSITNRPLVPLGNRARCMPMVSIGAGLRGDLVSNRLLIKAPSQVSFDHCTRRLEKAWLKLKQVFAPKARTAEALDHAISEALNAITADNAAAWFRYCGYAL